MEQELDTLNLIKHYINISNTALSESEKHNRLLSEKTVLTTMASGSTVSFCVTDGKSVSEDVYTTRIFEGQFTPVQ